MLFVAEFFFENKEKKFLFGVIFENRRSWWNAVCPVTIIIKKEIKSLDKHMHNIRISIDYDKIILLIA